MPCQGSKNQQPRSKYNSHTMPLWRVKISCEYIIRWHNRFKAGELSLSCFYMNQWLQMHAAIHHLPVSYIHIKNWPCVTQLLALDTVADLEFFKRRFQYAIKAHITCLLGHAPPPQKKNFGFWDQFWCIGVKLQKLDDLLLNLVVVFEALRIKVWLRFQPQRLQSSWLFV